MLVFIVEAVILCAIFTLIVARSVRKNPLAWVSDYPPAIRQRVKELGLTVKVEKLSDPRVLARKLIATAVCLALLCLLMVKVNGVWGWGAFWVSYGLWLVVAWYDALVLDCLWFANDRRVRIPGTEDMEAAYHDYGFHLRMSCRGSLLGLPVCAIVGGLTALLG